VNQNSRSPYTSHCFCTDWDDTDCQLKGNKIKCSSLALNSCLLKYRYMSMYTTWHVREQIDCDRGESVLWFWKVNRRCGQIEVFLKLKCFGKAKAMYWIALYYWLNWLQRPLLTLIHRHNQTFPNFALCLQRLNLHALWWTSFLGRGAELIQSRPSVGQRKSNTRSSVIRWEGVQEGWLKPKYYKSKVIALNIPCALHCLWTAKSCKLVKAFGWLDIYLHQRRG